MLMKKVFLIAAVILSIKSFAQDYSDVIKVDSSSASQLYSHAKLFISNSFKSYSAATDLDDEAGKVVVVKGIIPVTVVKIGMPPRSEVNFSLKIECREGRYKYTFSDFLLYYQPGRMTKEFVIGLSDEDPKGVSKKQLSSVREQVDKNINSLIASLKKEMASSSASGSDW